MHRSIRPSAGFTLAELLIVTVVISLLAIAASPTIKAYLERARIAKGMSVGRTIQASLASFATTSGSNQYPASIDLYGQLTVLINANGGQLRNTETETGMAFRKYTPLDSDGDHTWNSYTMSFIVLNVSPKRPGWCIRIQPSGVERCPPQ